MMPSFGTRSPSSPYADRLSVLTALLVGSLWVGVFSGCRSAPDPDPSFAEQSAPPPHGDVPTFRGNAARTGWMPGPGPSGPDVSEQWVVDTGAPVHGSPAVVGGTLYVGAQNGTLYAVDTDQGAVQWEAEVSDEAIAASATVADSVVYVGVQALDVATGAVRWNASEHEYGWNENTSGLFAAPAVDEGRVYTTTGIQLLVLTADRGSNVWDDSPLIPTYLYAPTVAEGTVFSGHPVTTYQGPITQSSRHPPGPERIGTIAARQARDGSKRWRFTDAERRPPFFFPNPMGESIRADEEDLAPDPSARRNGDTAQSTRPITHASTHAASAMTTYTYGPLGSATAAVSDGMLYTQTNEGVVYALDAITGAPVWTFDTMPDFNSWDFNSWRDTERDVARIAASPAVAHETVYIGTEKGQVVALDVRTGAVRWKTELGGAIRSSPAVADETLYVGSTDGHLYALDTATGSVSWQFETGGPVVSSPAVTGGVVYVGSHDGRIYALE